MTVPIRPHYLIAWGLLLLSIVSTAACSSDTTSASKTTGNAATNATTSAAGAGGDLASFCAAGETINARTATIAGPDEAVAAFTELDATLDTLLASAPDEVAEAAATFVSTARSSVATGDFSPFEDGTIDGLVGQFDAICAEG